MFHTHTISSTKPDNHSVLSSSLSSSVFSTPSPSSTFIHIKHHFYFIIYFSSLLSVRVVAYLLSLSLLLSHISFSMFFFALVNREISTLFYMSTTPCVRMNVIEMQRVSNFVLLLIAFNDINMKNNRNRTKIEEYTKQSTGNIYTANSKTRKKADFRI